MPKSWITTLIGPGGSARSVAGRSIHELSDRYRYLLGLSQRKLDRLESVHGIRGRTRLSAPANPSRISIRDINCNVVAIPIAKQHMERIGLKEAYVTIAFVGGRFGNPLNLPEQLRRR